MKQFNFRSMLPHLGAVVIFICLIFIYFPELLDKKTLRMDDIEQHKGMSNELADYRERTGEEAIWTNSMFGGMPGYLISVVYHGNIVQYVGKFIKIGLPRPADSMFVLMLGMYFLLLVLKVRPPLAVAGAAAYCFSTYNLLIMEAGHMSKVDGISWMPWVFAGIILTFNGKTFAGALITAIFLSLQIKAGHLQVTYYLSFILGFYAIAQLVYAIVRKKIPEYGKSLAAVAIAGLFGLLTNSSSLYTIYDYGKDSIRGKSELTTKKNKDEGGLDKNYALDYSYGIGETFSYMIPNVYGGASNLDLASQKSALKEADEQYRGMISQLPQYWSETSTTGPFYAGAFVCFLFVLALFLVSNPIRWAILGTALLAIILSWGKNAEGFSVFMLNTFPLYNKFRAVKMTLVITDFLIPLLAILGLNEVIKNPGIIKIKKREFIAAFALTGGLSLLFYLMPDSFFSFDYLNPAIASQITEVLKQNGLDGNAAEGWMSGMQSSLEAVRIAIFKADALRAFGFILFGAALVWAYDRFRFPVVVLAISAGLLIIGDLWSVDKRYINKKDFIPLAKAEIPFTPSAADEAIYQMELKNDPGLKQRLDIYRQSYPEQKRSKNKNEAAEDAKYRFRALLGSTNYRVLNLTARAGIFNDAGTSFFHKSVGGYSAAKLERYQEFIEFHLDSNKNAIYRILNGTLSDSAMQTGLQQLYALNMLNTRYIIYNEKAPPIVNKAAKGNAWFVNEVKMVKNADEEIAAVRGIDPGKVAIVDERFSEVIKPKNTAVDSTARIRLNSYAPNKLVYSSSASTSQVAVFSEIYYAKGWKAFIDGKESPHFRVNYILRGMAIPAGKHEIEFRFEPAVYQNTEMVAYASSSVLLVCALAYLIFLFRKNQQKAATN
jgi:hypothetical protein